MPTSIQSVRPAHHRSLPFIPPQKLKPHLTSGGFSRDGFLDAGFVSSGLSTQLSTLIAGFFFPSSHLVVPTFLLSLPAGFLLGTTLYVFAHFASKLSRLAHFKGDINILDRALNADKEIGGNNVRRLARVIARIHDPEVNNLIAESVSLETLSGLALAQKLSGVEFAYYRLVLAGTTHDPEFIDDCLLRFGIPLDRALAAAQNPHANPVSIARFILGLKLSEDPRQNQLAPEVFQSLSAEKRRPVLEFFKENGEDPII